MGDRSRREYDSGLCELKTERWLQHALGVFSSVATDLFEQPSLLDDI